MHEFNIHGEQIWSKGVECLKAPVGTSPLAGLVIPKLVCLTSGCESQRRGSSGSSEAMRQSTWEPTLPGPLLPQNPSSPRAPSGIQRGLMALVSGFSLPLGPKVGPPSTACHSAAELRMSNPTTSGPAPPAGPAVAHPPCADGPWGAQVMPSRSGCSSA